MTTPDDVGRSDEITDDRVDEVTDDLVDAAENIGTADESAAPAPEGTEPSAAEAEAAMYKDLAVRIQADFENYRKRVAAQQADEVARATGRLVEALLPVLDACEAAFTHGATGVEPIWSALLGELQRQGLEPIDLAGKPFDPEVAEAVVHEEAGGGQPVVSEVLRTGYRWKDRVLRAAVVKVRG